MKKILFCLSLVLIGILSAQTTPPVSITLTPEGVMTTTQSTGIALSDPLNKPTSQPVTSTGSNNLSLNAEMDLNSTSKSLTLPLAYNWGNWNFNLSIPWYFDRSVQYSSGVQSSSGLGDITSGAGYNNLIEKLDSLNYQVRAKIKLPTGDDKNMEGKYLVPLGSGSYDTNFGFTVSRKYGKYALYSSFDTRFNSVSKKTTEMKHNEDPDGNATTIDIETIDYEISNGSSYKINFGCNYDLYNRLDLLTSLNMGFYTDGTTDITHKYSWTTLTDKETGRANNQDFTVMDLNLGLSYDLLFLEAGFGLDIPVYTKRNAASKEDDRGISFKLKMDYKLF